MRTITESVKSLKIEINTVLQYFFWQGMPEALQRQLIDATDTNKHSLSQINENIFDALDRYGSRKARAKPTEVRSKTSRFAVDVQYKMTLLSVSNVRCV